MAASLKSQSAWNSLEQEFMLVECNGLLIVKYHQLIPVHQKQQSHEPQLSSVKVSGVIQSLQGVSGVAQQSHGCGSLQNQCSSPPQQYS